MEFLKIIASGAVGAGVIAGIFMLLGKFSDHKHEDKKERMSEIKQLRADVSELSESYKMLEQKIENLVENDRALMKAVNALLLHNMTGNATGKMAAAQQELTNYIIEHGDQ